MKNQVSLVINAFNEEDNIARTIQEAVRDLERLALDDFEIIVVDDGSQDRTRSIVEELTQQIKQLRLISHPQNRGYGASLTTGFRAARMPLVFHVPGDGQSNVPDLKLFLDAIGDYDVVVGYIPKRKDPLVRKVLSGGYILLVRLIFGLEFKNTNSIKLYRRSVLDSIDIKSEGPFMDTEVLVRLKRLNKKFYEVPVSHNRRLAGRSKGANWQAIKKTLIELIKFLGEK